MKKSSIEKSTEIRREDKNFNKKISKLYNKKENCCGCTACYAICPVNAIEMKLDKEGFLYPEIDESKCIGCRKCLGVCAFKIHQAEKGFLK